MDVTKTKCKDLWGVKNKTDKCTVCKTATNASDCSWDAAADSGNGEMSIVLGCKAGF